MLSAVKGVVLAAQGNPEKALELASVMELHKHRFGPQTDFSIQITEILINAERYDAALGIDRQGHGSRAHHNFLLEMPDMLRAKGEALIFAKRSDMSAAENCLRQSLDLARRQAALGFELRTGVSLGRIWLQQGRREDAREVLGPVYARFTEGFNTRLLTTARELLDELGSPRPGSLGSAQ